MNSRSESLKVLFDLTGIQPVDGSKRHGGARYGEAVLRRIIERRLSVSCCYNSHEWLNPDIANLLTKSHIKVTDLHEKDLGEIVETDQIEVIYTPLPTLHHINFKKCHVVGTIHDVRALEKQLDIAQIEYKPWNNIYRYYLKRIFNGTYRRRKSKYYEAAFTSHFFDFVTVSYHTAFALKTYFPQYIERDIPVFYSPEVTYAELEDSKYQDKFFLLVSAERFDKNVLRAIKALDRLFSYGVAPGFRVRITGLERPDAFWYKLKEPERFEFLGFVDDRELAHLFHDAYCFIYPSLSEGFGYPPLEAMHFGVPVLASPFTAISEICGGGAIYFNPLSIEEIMNRIQYVLRDDVYEKFSALAKERAVSIEKKQRIDLDRLVDYIYKVEKETDDKGLC